MANTTARRAIVPAKTPIISVAEHCKLSSDKIMSRESQCVLTFAMCENWNSIYRNELPLKLSLIRFRGPINILNGSVLILFEEMSRSVRSLYDLKVLPSVSFSDCSPSTFCDRLTRPRFNPRFIESVKKSSARELIPFWLTSNDNITLLFGWPITKGSVVLVSPLPHNGDLNV